MEDQQQQSKKFKSAICIICGGNAQFTEKNEFYSTFLSDQLIPKSDKTLLCKFKCFDFCVGCIEVIENLHQLHSTLNFIQQSIEQKNTEIRIKILKSKIEIDDENANLFRKISTRDLCPSVQLNKDSKLSTARDKNRHKVFSNSSSVQKHVNPKGVQREETGSTSNCLKPISISKIVKGKESSIQTNSCPKPVTFSAQSLTLDKKCENEKTGLDKVGISRSKSTRPMPIKEQEVAINFGSREKCNLKLNDGDKVAKRENEDNAEVKKETSHLPDGSTEDCNKYEMCEPLEEFSLDEGKPVSVFTVDEDDEITVIDIVDNESQVISENQDLSSLGHGSKQWKKPTLTSLELSFLAILTSNNVQMIFSDICNFIVSHFPYFKNTFYPYPDRWKHGLRMTLSKSEYFTCNRSDDPDTLWNYSVNNSKEAKLVRERLQNKLSLWPIHTVLHTMAFPEHILDFQTALKGDFLEPSHLQEKAPNDSIRTLAAQNTNVAKPKGSVETSSTPSNLFDNDGNLNSNAVSRLIRQNVKMWPKPPFSSTEMAILAITSSDQMRMTISEICDFVSYNFPFYDPYNCVDTWKHYLKHSVLHCVCFAESPSSEWINYNDGNFEMSYTVKDCDDYCEYRKKILEKLTLEAYKYTAFPEKIPYFREYLMRDLSARDKMAINLPKDISDDRKGNSEIIIGTINRKNSSWKGSKNTPKSDERQINRNSNVNDSKKTSKAGESKSRGNSNEIRNTSKTDQVQITRQLQKQWSKPPITVQDISLLAIMSHKNMRMTSSEIHDFMLCNFPYFNSNNGNWKAYISCVLSTCQFIAGFSNRPSLVGNEKSEFIYVAIKSDDFYQSRDTLNQKLTTLRQDISESMMYPENLALYRQSLMRRIPDSFQPIEEEVKIEMGTGTTK